MSTIPGSGERLDQPIDYPKRMDIFLASVAIGSSYAGKAAENPTFHKILLVTALVTGGIEMWRFYHAEDEPELPPIEAFDSSGQL